MEFSAWWPKRSYATKLENCQIHFDTRHALSCCWGCNREKDEAWKTEHTVGVESVYMLDLSSQLRIAARSHEMEEKADGFGPDELEEAWPSERFPRRPSTFDWAGCTVRVYCVASEVPNEFRLEKFPLCTESTWLFHSSCPFSSPG